MRWGVSPGEGVEVWWEGELASYLDAAVSAGAHETWLCAFPYEPAEIDDDFADLADTPATRALIQAAETHLGEAVFGAMEWRHSDGRWFGYGWAAAFRVALDEGCEALVGPGQP